jgi:hypothetical protein
MPRITVAETTKASASSSRSNKVAAQTLLWALKPLSDIHGTRLPLSYVIAFLTVTLDEGKGTNAYARDLGIDRRLMSRFLQDIGNRGRNGGPGLGLVEVKELHDPHQKTEVFLTAKGRAIADHFSRELRRLSRRSN